MASLLQRIKEVAQGKRKGVFSPLLTKAEQRTPIATSLKQIGGLIKQEAPKVLTGQYGIQRIAKETRQASEELFKPALLELRARQQPAKKTELLKQAQESKKRFTEAGVEIGIALTTPGPQKFQMTEGFARKILNITPKAQLTEDVIGKAFRSASTKTAPRTIQEAASRLKTNSQVLTNQARDFLVSKLKPIPTPPTPILERLRFTKPNAPIETTTPTRPRVPSIAEKVRSASKELRQPVVQPTPPAPTPILDRLRVSKPAELTEIVPKEVTKAPILERLRKPTIRPVEQKPPEFDADAFESLVRQTEKEGYKTLIADTERKLGEVAEIQEAEMFRGPDEEFFAGLMRNSGATIARVQDALGGDVATLLSRKPDGKLRFSRGPAIVTALEDYSIASAPQGANISEYRSSDEIFDALKTWRSKPRAVARAEVRQLTKQLNILQRNLDKLEGYERKLAVKRINKTMALVRRFEKATARSAKVGVLQRIRKTTGITRAREVVKTDVATLLRKRLRDEARGAQFGATEARRLTRDELLDQFRQKSGRIKTIQRELISIVKDQLPSEEVGRFVQAISNATSKIRAAKVMEKIEERVIEVGKRTLVGEIKKVFDKPGNIAVDYKKRLSVIADQIDLTKPTESTLKRLRGLSEFLSREGVPLGIAKQRLDELTRLSKKPLKDMSPNDLIELKNHLDIIQKQGALKARLKNTYNARVREANLKTLLASTRNFDPPFQKGKKLTRLQQARVDGVRAYFNTLHTPRVADALDGYKGYSGPNAKLIKEMGAAETKAKFEAKTSTIEALEELQRLGITELTEEQQVKVMLHIRQREGAQGAVDTLMKKYGLSEMPPLTDVEEQAIGIIQKYVNANKNKVAATFEELNGEIFPEMDTYILPLKYEGEFNILPEEMIKPTRGRTTKVEQGFTKGRVTGVQKVPRIDVLGLMEEAIHDQAWYLHMQPFLSDTAQLVKNPDYQKQAGEIASNWWSIQLDSVARRGLSATAQTNATLRNIRINLNKAILGYKLSTILMQPFALVDALAYSVSRWGVKSGEIIKEFTKAWINPRLARETIKASPALQLRQAGELAVEEFAEAAKRGKISRSVLDAMSLLKAADVKTAAGVQNGLEGILMKSGVSDAKQEAEFLMNLVSGSSEISYRPQVLASGELARTWFTFKTFFLNRWGIMAHDLIASGVIKGDWKKKFGALLGLGIFAAGAIAEEEARKAVNNFITQRKPKEEPSTISTVLRVFPENIPYFGEFISSLDYGGDVDTVVMRTLENVFKGGAAIVTGKEPETKIKGGLRLVEAIASLLGIPGTAQVTDIAQGLLVPDRQSSTSVINDIYQKSQSEKITDADKARLRTALKTALDKNELTYKEASDKLTKIAGNWSAMEKITQLQSLTPTDREAAMRILPAEERNQLNKFIANMRKQQAKSGKQPAYGIGETTDSGSILDTVIVYAKALGTDPLTAFNRIFTGQRIRRLDNKTIIVERMPLATSQGIKSDLGAVNGLILDHTIPLELGGSNDKTNLKLVPYATWQQYTLAENHLGTLLRAGKITKARAQSLITDYKGEKINLGDILAIK